MINVGNNSGTGTLNILDGGAVTGGNLSIGINDATGTLNIANGGVLAVTGDILVGNSAVGTATFNIGTGGAAGVVNAPRLTSLVGTNDAVNFNHTDTNYYFTNDGTAGGAAVLITGNLAVKQMGSGTTILSGTNTYAGGTTVSAGTLAGTTTSLQGTITNNANVTFDQTTNGTYAGVMSGTGALTKSGAGTVTLSGANNYSGGTTVSAGTLAGTTTSLQGAIVNNATVNFDQTTNSTYAGVMSGTGALTKAGSGTLTLSGANSYTGATNVNAGTLQAGAANTFSSASAMTVATGATLDFNGFAQSVGSIAGAGTVTLGGATLTAGGDNSSATLSGAIGGSGALIKTGTGTLTLTGANNYTGGTTVSAGTLAGTTTSLQGAIVNNAAVSFDQTTNGTYAGAMSGSGALVKTGTGTLTLTGANNYSGGTTVSAGTLAGTTTSLQGAIINNATVNFDQTTDGSYAGIMSGTGALTKAGTGTVTLSGANSYAGGTTVSAGTLAGTTTSLQGAIVNNATVTFDQTTSGTYAGAMSGTGALTKAGTGTVTLTGANTYAGGTTVSAGTLAGTTTSLQGAIANNATVSFDQTTNGTYAGEMSGTGALTKAGAGTVTLSGANSYAGGTTVSAGTLAGTTTSLQGAIVNNATVTFDQTADGSYAGVMSGTGALTKAGTGTVTLSGANTYAGGTTVSAGTLAGTTTSLQGAIVNNAAVAFDQVADGTYAGVMSGSGTLAKSGAGILTLSGTNTYTGATAVNAGTLAVNGSIDSPVTVNSGGVLGGSGTINNTVTTASGGVFAPGNSIGTITVNGSLAFSAGSIYRVEVDAAGNADRINVTGTPGTATIDGGTVDVQAGAGTYQANTQYTILDAAGGVTGTFADVTSNLAFLTPALAYDANSVTLALARNDLSFASAAATPNQEAVATVLQTASAGATGDLATVVNTVTGLSAPQAQAAFDSIGGASLIALRRAGTAFAGGFGQQLNRRLGLVASSDAARQTASFGSPLQLAANDWFADAPPVYAQAGAGAASGSSGPQDGRGLWLRAYGADNRTDGDANAAGDTLRSGGITLGADTEVRRGLVLGVAATTGTSHLSFDGISDSGRSRGNALGVYASYVAGPWTYKGIAGTAWNANHMDRNVMVGAIARSATSDFDSRSQSLYAEATYDIQQTGFMLQPLAALSYVRTRTEGYTETGAGALNLQVAAQTTESTRTLLGAKTVHQLGRLKLEPRLLWAHEFGNVNAPMSASLAGAPAAGSFQVSGVALKRDSVILGFGASGELRKGIDLYADIQSETNSRQHNLALFVGLRGVW
ncbi:MAG: autotransporter-associated beta strand repeat-containing protein [Burkholderiales bacterium]|nr:autotransporter-associated beta strand repeat-containing protein [Burkholderiales bacterium]